MVSEIAAATGVVLEADTIYGIPLMRDLCALVNPANAGSLRIGHVLRALPTTTSHYWVDDRGLNQLSTVSAYCE